MVKIILSCLILVLISGCGGGGSGSKSSKAAIRVLPNGYFGFSDAEQYAIHAEVFDNGRKYKISHINLVTMKYQKEIGTISYDGDKLTFKIEESLPPGCMSGQETWKFSNTDTTITLEALTPDQAYSFITTERISESLSQAFGGTIFPGCWF